MLENIGADETVYTAEELAKAKKMHASTVRKLFLNEPGVIRFGAGRRLGKRQYFTLRIPHSVAARVWARMTVGN